MNYPHALLPPHGGFFCTLSLLSSGHLALYSTAVILPAAEYNIKFAYHPFVSYCQLKPRIEALLAFYPQPKFRKNGLFISYY